MNTIQKLFNSKSFIAWPPLFGCPKLMMYDEYIWHKYWKARADENKRRAGYECEKCGTGANLTTHHKTYKRLGNEPQSDLVCLCWPCHKKEHN